MVRSLHAVHVLAIGLLAAAVAPPRLSAQSVGEWREVPSVNTPPARTGFGLLRLPDGRIAMMGGDSSNALATDWVWDGIDWQPYANVVPRRDNAAMTDFGIYGGLLFGGNDSTGQLTDTWRYQESTGWYQVSWPFNPPVLTDTSAAYDPASEQVVLVGRNQSGVFETWFYRVTNGWLSGETFSTAKALVASDSVRGEALLMTGRFPSVEVSRLVNSQWLPLAESSQAFAIGDACFDARRGRVVIAQSHDSQEVVEWDGQDFLSPTSPTGGYVPPSRMAVEYHAERFETIMATNYSGTMQTWRWVIGSEPHVVTHGASCGTFQPMVGLAAGDSPQPGASHRVELTASSVGNYFALMVFGFSHTENQGAPLPQTIPLGSANCDLLVEAASVVVAGAGAPQSVLVTLPPGVDLLGERYDVQGVLLSGANVLSTSNALEVQIGLPLAEQQLIESFDTDANRDFLASGDTWGNGQVTPGQIGNDGRHGSFDPTLGAEIEPGVYEWSTDSMVIPASHTLSGEPIDVIGGNFYFTDFVVPAGVTVKFTGSQPARVYVRGNVSIIGAVSVDAEDMPFAVATAGPAIGERISSFDARMGPAQPGGISGPGGGRGGDGAVKCNNVGPIVVSGVALTDGQPGDDVQVFAGHAYAGQTGGTGGQGSPMVPATGIWPGLTTSQMIGFIYVPYHSAGGSGGGYSGPGGVAESMTVTGATQPVGPSPVAGGGAFSIAPFPANPPTGYTSLEHYSVGGSGGGGGGSHGYGQFGIGLFDRWYAGHGGTGGGGVLQVRAGSNILVSGEVSARGGRGVIINGDNPDSPFADTNFGVSSPGGGGSGGTMLLQSNVVVAITGSVDASGGIGSTNEAISVTPVNGTAGGADGADGFYRLESNGPNYVTGSATPTFTSDNSGVLNDVDQFSGSRSRWLLPATSALPVYVRYELLVDIGGLPVLFSDDPSVSPVAADSPTGAVYLRFQGAELDPLAGTAVEGTEGPWRTTLVPGVDSVNRDRASAVRFDMVFNKNAGDARVLELRIVWR